SMVQRNLYPKATSSAARSRRSVHSTSTTADPSSRTLSMATKTNRTDRRRSSLWWALPGGLRLRRDRPLLGDHEGRILADPTDERGARLEDLPEERIFG